MKKLLRQIVPGLILLVSCVDPAEFDTPPFKYQIVVDGFINTDPGPYTVKIFRSQQLETGDLDRLAPEISAKVKIIDDLGNEELLKEVENGVYQTAVNGIQGTVGRTYHLEFTNNKGLRFESEPELLKPVGEITAINHVFVEGSDETTDSNDGFRILADATGIPDVDDLLRLRMVVTYKIETHPELRTRRTDEGILPDPYPCSGYENRGGNLVQVSSECSCCLCWVSEYDEIPSIANEQFISNDNFFDLEVGFVAANRRTLYEKIHVEVQALSLSPMAYQFWKMVKAQKEGASNIFQPPSGKIKGNIRSLDSDDEVLGIFWAAAINRESVFIDRNDVPYSVPAIDTIIAPCTYLPYSVNQMPPFWE
jgi:hypothetical protein